MDVFDAGDNVCYYYSEDVEVQDLEQQSESRPFITRGFPCHAANDSSNFDKINGGYSPLNEVFIYSQNVHDCFRDWVGRPPLGNTNANGDVTNRVKIYGERTSYTKWQIISLETVSCILSHNFQI